MRLAVSNIAWHPGEDEGILDGLGQLGVDALEIAPTRVFPDPAVISLERAARYAAVLRDRGLEVVAFQSMLFGRPDLTVFDSPQVRAATLARLARFIELAGVMRVGRLVFGSPHNRRLPPDMSTSEAADIAIGFFDSLADAAEANGTVLCIEPNPEEYGCNFITTAEQGAQLVQTVDRPGFALHLDAAGMTIAGDDVAASIRNSKGVLRHFHASAPNLGDLEDSTVDHAAAAQALRTMAYGGVVSIEMRSQAEGTNAARVVAAIRLARKHYMFSH